MPKELYPEIKIPVLVVNTVYLGASAEDIENTVTKVLENELVGGLKQVDEITSSSKENVSSITIKLNEKADAKAIKEDVNDILKQNRSALPKDAEEPFVFEVSFSEQPVYIFAISSTEALNNLYKISDELKNELKKVNGVSKISVSGIGERQITVLLDKNKLLQYNVTPQEVSRAISSAKNVFPVGSIKFNQQNLSVLYQSNVTNYNSLEHIVVKNNKDSFVTVKDLAVQIEDGLSETKTFSRISKGGLKKQQAVVFAITKQEGGNIMVLTKNIQETIKKFQEEKQLESDFIEVIDFGDDIKEQLSELVVSGLQTILIVILIVGLFVGTKEAIIAAFAIPLSFLISFIIMFYLGQTINFMSLFSLILVIGILIDSSIVIVEGISDRIEKHKNIKDAAFETLQVFSKPVIAGTLTTVAVFLPLLTLSGIVGQFMGAIPKTIITVLFISLFVALAFIPSLLIIFSKTKIRNFKKAEKVRESVFDKISEKYISRLRKVLSNQKIQKQIRYSSIALFFVMIAFVVSGLIGSAFFPPEEYDRIFINYQNKVNTDLKTTSQKVKEIEDLIQKDPKVLSFTTTIGQSSAFTAKNPGVASSERANIVINIEDKKSSFETIAYLEKELKKFNADGTIEVIKPQSGPPTGSPIEVKLFSEDLEILEKYALKTFEILNSIKGVKNASTGFDLGVKKIVLKPNEYKLAQKGLTSTELSLFLRSNIYGVLATSLNLKGESVDVHVKTNLNSDSRSHTLSNNVNVESIKNTIIKTRAGNVPVGSLFDIEIKSDRRNIGHQEGKRYIAVASEVQDGFNTALIQKEFEKKLKEIDFKEAGIEIKFEGDAEASSDSSRELMISLIYGILLMILVLMWQFNSFKDTYLILSVIPMGLVGVLIGLFITNKDLSFTAMLGFIALVGIVVNNSIILVDTFNNLKKKNKEEKLGQTLEEIIVQGAILRLKPILITTATTVFGMVPLIFVSNMWSPFAIALIFGLTFSTFVTLFLVPIRYLKAYKNVKN